MTPFLDFCHLSGKATERLLAMVYIDFDLIAHP
jgi:hypothetical protein